MKYQPNLGQYGSPNELPQLYWNVKSSEQRLKLICDELDRLNLKDDEQTAKDSELNHYLDKLNAQLHRLRLDLNQVMDEMRAQLEGGKTRNPVTGAYDYNYVAEKQAYDLLRVYASTWEEVADSGLTWEDIAKKDITNAEFDMFGNLYFGDGSIRAKITDAADIDKNTVGFGGKFHG